MKKLKPIRTADATTLYLNKTDNFQKFFGGLIECLHKKLTKVKIKGVGRYFTCGQAHERYNKNWEPFQHLWTFTEKNGLDFYVARDLIEEKLFKELLCECEILGDNSEVRRKELEKFGVYFGDPGGREVDVI